MRYLVVGGYAVGLHGYPRATVDLDVWVAATPDNADRIMQSLRAFGFDLPELDAPLFVDPRSIVRFWHAAVPDRNHDVDSTVSNSMCVVAAQPCSTSRACSCR